ncbi:hypothetical protein OKW42_005462 [Paraburkholderia sp. WC7.3d]
MGRLLRRPYVDYGPNRDAPSQGSGKAPTGKCIVSAHTDAHSHIRVETVEGIVGELPYKGGNKVFQVVTPAR